jgi:hypothetical protein
VDISSGLYLVGGYKISQEQVYKWCRAHDINPPAYEIMLTVNRWLSRKNIRTRIFAHNFNGMEEECSFVVVTDKRSTTWSAEMIAFEETDRARYIKLHLGMDDADLEFVTVRKVLKTRRSRRSMEYQGLRS